MKIYMKNKIIIIEGMEHTGMSLWPTYMIYYIEKMYGKKVIVNNIRSYENEKAE